MATIGETRMFSASWRGTIEKQVRDPSKVKVTLEKYDAKLGCWSKVGAYYGPNHPTPWRLKERSVFADIYDKEVVNARKRAEEMFEEFVK